MEADTHEGQSGAHWNPQDYEWSGLTMTVSKRPQQRGGRHNAAPSSSPAQEEVLGEDVPVMVQRPSTGPGNSKAKLVCQIQGCNASLVSSKLYYQRFKLCEQHLKAPAIAINGVLSRLCQQCGRFHDLSAFEGKKRTCRVQLDRIRTNKLMRKQHKEAHEGTPDGDDTGRRSHHHDGSWGPGGTTSNSSGGSGHATGGGGPIIRPKRAAAERATQRFGAIASDLGADGSRRSEDSGGQGVGPGQGPGQGGYRPSDSGGDSMDDPRAGGRTGGAAGGLVGGNGGYRSGVSGHEGGLAGSGGSGWAHPGEGLGAGSVASGRAPVYSYQPAQHGPEGVGPVQGQLLRQAVGGYSGAAGRVPGLGAGGPGLQPVAGGLASQGSAGLPGGHDSPAHDMHGMGHSMVYGASGGSRGGSPPYGDGAGVDEQVPLGYGSGPQGGAPGQWMAPNGGPAAGPAYRSGAAPAYAPAWQQQPPPHGQQHSLGPVRATNGHGAYDDGGGLGRQGSGEECKGPWIVAAAAAHAGGNGACARSPPLEGGAPLVLPPSSSGSQLANGDGAFNRASSGVPSPLDPLLGRTGSTGVTSAAPPRAPPAWNGALGNSPLGAPAVALHLSTQQPKRPQPLWADFPGLQQPHPQHGLHPGAQPSRVLGGMGQHGMPPHPDMGRPGGRAGLMRAPGQLGDADRELEGMLQELQQQQPSGGLGPQPPVLNLPGTSLLASVGGNPVPMLGRGGMTHGSVSAGRGAVHQQGDAVMSDVAAGGGGRGSGSSGGLSQRMAPLPPSGPLQGAGSGPMQVQCSTAPTMPAPYALSAGPLPSGSQAPTGPAAAAHSALEPALLDPFDLQLGSSAGGSGSGTDLMDIYETMVRNGMLQSGSNESRNHSKSGDGRGGGSGSREGPTAAERAALVAAQQMHVTRLQQLLQVHAPPPAAKAPGGPGGAPDGYHPHPAHPQQPPSYLPAAANSYPHPAPPPPERSLEHVASGLTNTSQQSQLHGHTHPNHPNSQGGSPPLVQPPAQAAAPRGSHELRHSDSGGSGTPPYVPRDFLTRVTIKLMDCLPDDLPPLLRANIQRWASSGAAAEVMQACMRPGCLELLVDVVHSCSTPEFAAHALAQGRPVEAARALTRLVTDRLAADNELVLEVNGAVLCLPPGGQPRISSWLDAAAAFAEADGAADQDPRTGAGGGKAGPCGGAAEVEVVPTITGCSVEVVPTITGCSVAAVRSGALVALTLAGDGLDDPRVTLCARMAGEDVQPATRKLPPRPAAAAESASASAAGADAAQGKGAPRAAPSRLSVHVRPPRAAGMLFLEARRGRLLGPWLPVLVLPDAAAAAEVNALAAAHADGVEGKLPNWLRSYLVDLGEVLDWVISTRGPVLTPCIDPDQSPAATDAQGSRSGPQPGGGGSSTSAPGTWGSGAASAVSTNSQRQDSDWAGVQEADGAAGAAGREPSGGGRRLSDRTLSSVAAGSLGPGTGAAAAPEVWDGEQQRLRLQQQVRGAVLAATASSNAPPRPLAGAFPGLSAAAAEQLLLQTQGSRCSAAGGSFASAWTGSCESTEANNAFAPRSRDDGSSGSGKTNGARLAREEVFSVAAMQDATAALGRRLLYKTCRLLAFAVGRGMVALSELLWRTLAAQTMGGPVASVLEHAYADGEGLLAAAVRSRSDAMVRSLLGDWARAAWAAKEITCIGPSGLSPLHLAASLRGCGPVAATLMELLPACLQHWHSLRGAAGHTPASLATHVGHGGLNALAAAHLHAAAAGVPVRYVLPPGGVRALAQLGGMEGVGAEAAAGEGAPVPVTPDGGYYSSEEEEEEEEGREVGLDSVVEEEEEEEDDVGVGARRDMGPRVGAQGAAAPAAAVVETVEAVAAVAEEAEVAAAASEEPEPTSAGGAPAPEAAAAPAAAAEAEPGLPPQPQVDSRSGTGATSGVGAASSAAPPTAGSTACSSGGASAADAPASSSAGRPDAPQHPQQQQLPQAGASASTSDGAAARKGSSGKLSGWLKKLSFKTKGSK